MHAKNVTTLGLGPPLFAAAMVLLAGCASPPGAMFDPAAGSYTWPAPPDPPRIKYVGQIRGEADLHASKGGVEVVDETLFGKRPTEVFVSPLAVCTDAANPARRVFIADSNGQCIHVLDLKTRQYKRWAPQPPQPRLSQPVAVAFEPGVGGNDGRLLVSDSAAGNIAVFNSTGERTGDLGAGVLLRPCGLAVDPVGRRVLVADAAAHQIVVLSDDGRELARVGRRGTGQGEFNYPTNVTLEPAERGGRLYVSDSLNFRVQVFGPTFEFVRQIGRKGDMPGYFSQPKGIATDPQGHVYVVDANFEAVQLFTPEGDLLMSFGHEGQGPGEFWLPAGIHIDAAGRIWIADSYNRRVQVFDLLPAPASPPAPPATPAQQENHQ
jgi:DNA-binding beta-propeller fold protein YncE